MWSCEACVPLHRKSVVTAENRTCALARRSLALIPGQLPPPLRPYTPCDAAVGNSRLPHCASSEFAGFQRKLGGASFTHQPSTKQEPHFSATLVSRVRGCRVYPLAKPCAAEWLVFQLST